MIVTFLYILLGRIFFFYSFNDFREIESLIKIYFCSFVKQSLIVSPLIL